MFNLRFMRLEFWYWNCSFGCTFFSKCSSWTTMFNSNVKTTALPWYHSNIISAARKWEKFIISSFLLFSNSTLWLSTIEKFDCFWTTELQNLQGWQITKTSVQNIFLLEKIIKVIGKRKNDAYGCDLQHSIEE